MLNLTKKIANYACLQGGYITLTGKCKHFRYGKIVYMGKLLHWQKWVMLPFLSANRP